MTAAYYRLMRGAQGIAAAANGADQIRHFSPAVWFVNGFAQTAQSSIWAECYGVRHLGAIKSVFWTLVVFASAIGPVWLGSLVDMGWLLQEAVMTMVVYLLGASVMLWVGVRSFKATSA